MTKHSRSCSFLLLTENIVHYLFITKRIIFNGVSRSIAWFDRHVIDGAMNGLALVTNRMSLAIRGLQSGQVQQYAFVFLVGLLLITVLVLFC